MIVPREKREEENGEDNEHVGVDRGKSESRDHFDAIVDERIPYPPSITPDQSRL
jgi:hypothetical protein